MEVRPTDEIPFERLEQVEIPDVGSSINISKKTDVEVMQTVVKRRFHHEGGKETDHVIVWTEKNKL
jgi:hypothetical protein